MSDFNSTIEITLQSFEVDSFDEAAWKQQWKDAELDGYLERHSDNWLMNPELSKQKSYEKDGVKRFFIMIPYKRATP